MVTKRDDLLSIGDVVEADTSWRITAFDQATKKVVIDQNMKFDENDNRVVNYDGAEFSNVTFSGGRTGKNETLLERAENASLSVRGKYFIVLETNMQGGSSSGPHGESMGYPNGHFVTAKECDNKGNLIEDGLTANFYQTGCFNIMVKNPKVVGKRLPAFSDFQAC